MFIDRAVIEVRSGKGGDGAIAFRREKYIAKGGPAGGNGGRGASIILKANSKINTLFNFRHSKCFIGPDGEKGGIKNQYGHHADDIIVEVPVGTVVYEEKDHKFLGDLSVDGVIEYLDENSSARTDYKYSVRKQSYSRTLGPISKVSTVGSTVGDLVNLGEIEKFNITKESNSLSCFFGDMTYSYGGKMNYKINFKFDDGEEKTVSTFQRRNGYNYASISIPNGASSATVRLEVSNNIGFTSKTISLNLVSTLPEVTNFIVLPVDNYVLYNNQKAEFIWNNLNIEGAKYTIQESSDSFIWDDLAEISNSTNVFNIKKEVLLSNKSGTMYYRIKIEKETEVNYSSVYQIQVYDFLDEIKNIRLNGTRFKQTTNVSEGDEFTLSWGIIPDADYRVLVSSDGTGWTSVLSYSSKASIEKSGTTASTKIEFNYKYMHLLLKIEASLNGKYTYSDIFEFYVTVDDLYADDVVNYFMKEYKLFLSDMGIYNEK